MAESDQGSGAGIAPYTRTGDDGTTTLGDLTRVSKSDARIEAYAAVEEANAAIGAAVAASGGLPPEVVTVLSRAQNDLIEVAGDLGMPVPENAEDPQLRIDESYVDRVEWVCDHFNDQLPLLGTVVLPGGTESGSQLYLAGTVVRRAERRAWLASEKHKDVNTHTGRYLNRLADLLFVLGRMGNAEHGDYTWQPRLTTQEGLFPAPPEPTGEAEG